MLKKILITLGVILGVYLILFFWPIKSNKDMIVGVSYDPGQARFLGLDATSTFNKILNDWNFKYLRLSAHWNVVEPAPGQFNFQELDYFLEQAWRADAKVLLAFGQKTPRWPECHAPAWTALLSDEEYFAALNNYATAVVGRYKNNSAVEMWQVENEPFLAFGEQCRKMSKQQLAGEVALARATGKPTVATDSGELSTWFKTARVGDWFGTTLYRVVWGKSTGYWSYDWLPPVFYRVKAFFTGVNKEKFLVSELQAEPWAPSGNVATTSLDEQSNSMDLKRLQNNIAYARKMGVSRAYLWGVEWWVWLAGQGNGEILEYIKNLDKRHPAN